MEKWEEDILKILKTDDEKNFDYSAIDNVASSCHLPREEFLKIIQQFEQDQEELTLDALSIVVDWARDAGLKRALLELILLGALAISTKNGEIAFRRLVDI